MLQLVQGMYANARSQVCVGEGYNHEFEVKVGVHQGSVLSTLLFIIVLLWSSLGGPICRSSLLTRWRNVAGGS